MTNELQIPSGIKNLHGQTLDDVHARVKARLEQAKAQQAAASGAHSLPNPTPAHFEPITYYAPPEVQQNVQPIQEYSNSSPSFAADYNPAGHFPPLPETNKQPAYIFAEPPAPPAEPAQTNEGPTDYIGHAGIWQGRDVVTASQPTYHSDGNYYIQIKPTDWSRGGYVKLDDIKFNTAQTQEAVPFYEPAPQIQPARVQRPGRSRMARRERPPATIGAHIKLSVAAAAAALAIVSSDFKVNVNTPNIPSLLPAASQKHTSFFDRFKNLIPHKNTILSANAPAPKPQESAKQPEKPVKFPGSAIAPKTEQPNTKLETPKVINPPEPAAAKLPEKWTPKENTRFDDNGLIAIGLSETKPGILDLKYKDQKSGEWILYNNLVPVATANGSLSNAEIDMVAPKRIVSKDKNGESTLVYRYSFPNGAIVDLKVDIEPSKKSVIVTSNKAANSAAISEYYVGNFFGLQTGVNAVEIDGVVYKAGDQGIPSDAAGKNGKFAHLNFPSNHVLTLIGNGPKQRHELISSNSQARAMKEDRLHEWDPKTQKELREQQVPPGKPWTETVAFVFNNFMSSSIKLSVD